MDYVLAGAGILAVVLALIVVYYALKSQTSYITRYR